MAHTGLIVVAVVGSVLVIALITVLLVWFYLGKKLRKGTSSTAENEFDKMESRQSILDAYGRRFQDDEKAREEEQLKKWKPKKSNKTPSKSSQSGVDVGSRLSSFVNSASNSNAAISEDVKETAGKVSDDLKAGADVIADDLKTGGEIISNDLKTGAEKISNDLKNAKK